MYLAQDRVINGKTIPKPVEYSEISSHRNILKLLDDFADLFPYNLPLGLPVPRETNHSIDLVEHANPRRIVATARETEPKRQLEDDLQAGHF